ncbi:NAD(P)H-quinone oxidoreductase [Lacticigenium naphthae]|uniref:NAD(P)H-quinone oxidoreductase n=1 Tax=Lacticigenium naphthae TaxID=515351 RepID=UPI0003F78993|nr:NAD(P)H-quinone oxidoreductase [Lacticigenium naphthae]
MRAWTISEPGGRDKLIQVDCPIPIPEKEELLIEVKAAGVNRTDVLTRQNRSLNEPYPILGVEISGVVVENKSEFPSILPGTRVAGLVNHGGYAEYVTIPADRVIVLPDSVSFIEGAGIPEVFLTAYQTLYWLGGLQRKETVLIHAGASGVGTAAIQLARHLSDATIFTTASRKEKLVQTKRLGADFSINYKEADFEEVIDRETGGYGVDVILDFIGASYWEKNLASAALDARWILIGTLGGSTVNYVSISSIMSKRLTLRGTLLTPRTDNYKAALTKEFEKKAFHLIKDRVIRPLIYSTVPFDEVPEAHRQMENNENTGKIIITLED